MKFYWFFRHYDINKELKDFIEDLYTSGFDGALFAYANFGDPFTILSRCINPDNEFEYIVAVRPWLISPQYLSNIIKSFNEIAPGRLSINFVPGELRADGVDGSGGIAENAVIGSVNDSSSQEDRRKYLSNYLSVFAKSNKEKTTTYISGRHHDIYNAFISYTDSYIINYQAFISSPVKKPEGKKLYVSIAPILHKNPLRNPKNGMVLSKDELVSILEDLESKDVDGVLFYNTHSDQLEHLKEFIKNYKSI